MPQAIRRYLKGNAERDEEGEAAATKPKPGPSKNRKPKPVYTVRDVLTELYRPAIDAEIALKSTDPDYLGSYQRAVTTVWNNMDDEQAEEVWDLVKEWNKEGAPTAIQLKLVFNFMFGWLV